MPDAVSFGWSYRGQRRPPFAIVPAPGQESVWDYPRPPQLVEDLREVVVRAGRTEIARTVKSYRVLETASPPTFYLPPEDVRRDLLMTGRGRSVCEWKGQAGYWDLVLDTQRYDAVAWSYPAPRPAYARLRDYVSFYPGRVDCFVDGVQVEPQPGGFYGGWLTPEVVGPVKGVRGTEHW